MQATVSKNGAAADRVLHIGVVHGVRSVNFVAAAETRAGMLEHLAAYVRATAEVQLYADDAAWLAALVETRDLEAAVGFYFDRVGERWDPEWLDECTLPVVP